MWSDPKQTTRLMCYYTLARDVRKQTERTVNVQCPYGARRHVEQVTGKPLSDIEKMAIFLNHFHADSRPGVAVRIATLVLIRATYEVMYKSVCEMYPIEETPYHRALLVTKSTELCRRHGLGTCPHSDADCRHIHKGKAGAFVLKLTGKSPGARTPPSTQPTGSKPYPNHIAERLRAVIGPYTGTVSATNPTGISRSQVKKVLALQRAEGEDPDPWSTGSIAHTSGFTDEGHHHPRVLMLRSSSSSSTAVYYGTPHHSGASDSSDSSDVDYTPVKFTPPRAKSCAFILTPSIDVARLMKTYLESVHPTDNGDRSDWVQFLSRHVTTQEKSPPTPILAILGWLTRGRQLSCARTDIANGSPALLHVVYLLSGAQYNGQYTMPQYRGYWNDDDFMTFSRLGILALMSRLLRISTRLARPLLISIPSRATS
jgi:hypothetical protein